MPAIRQWCCLFIASIACSNADDVGESGRQGESTAAAPSAAASSAAVSPDAMCREHGVLEAICTKCNPRLIPVFQAKGDWCKEHGFPESICPICHPERGGRPGHDIAADPAPADGLRVKFKRGDIERLAGIETVKALAVPDESIIVAPVRLAHDAAKLAHVNALSPGVVRRLEVDVGSRVKQGQSMAVIDSPTVGADRARVAAAASRVRVAGENHRRALELQGEGITSRRSLLEAEQELETAKAEHAALSGALSILGIGAGRVGSYTLRSPIGGVVTERRVTIGQVVGDEDLLFEVVDTSSIWADLDVAEADLGKVTVGQTVAVHLDVLPEREASGTISYVAPLIDPRTRTAKVRVPLANPDGMFRANMYGEGRILAATGESSVSVPRSAVQRAKDVHLVFVRLSDREYETRRVQLGPSHGESIEVRKGIRPGEEVATTGSFLLKTETLKGSIGAGCCEGE
jgi:cobalt-zinc-cadmium efflux system membrane fusion protein